MPDPTDRRAAAIHYRNPELVLEILTRLELSDLEPRELRDHVSTLGLDLAESTLGNTIADLADVGAIRSVYRRAQKRNELRLSVLGRAWLLGYVADPSLPNLEVKIEGTSRRVSWCETSEEEVR